MLLFPIAGMKHFLVWFWPYRRCEFCEQIILKRDGFKDPGFGWFCSEEEAIEFGSAISFRTLSKVPRFKGTT